MAKQIRRKDIIELNPFKNLEKSAKDAKTQVDLLENSLKLVKMQAKDIQKGMSTVKPKDVKTIKEFNQLTERANATAKAKLQIDQNLRKEKVRLQQLNTAQNKAIKDQLILNNKQAGTLQKLQAQNRKLRREREALNLGTKRGAKRLREINAQLDANNRVIERNSDRMKKQRLGIGRYTKALNGLRSGLARLGLAFGAFALIRDSFNVIKDFEQAQANLASVLGVNKDGMADLTDQAKELGATTTFTASQVSELQLELAKLGFTQGQIQDMTASTLLLAEATGTDLARAAEVTGATLRGFGLEADQTQRLVDTMAKSFSSSSLDMEKFSTAMAAVAPVAANVGFSVEETTGLLGTLTDRGIDASTAGTALRNIFLEAGKQGLTFQEAMDKINNSTDATGTAFELFGKRGATVATILAQNQESSDNLATTLKIASGELRKENFFELAEKAGMDFDQAMKEIAESEDKTAKATEIFGKQLAGTTVKMSEAGETSKTLEKTLEEQRNAAEKMAETQRNTLGGALALVRSAWEGFILKMNEAGGVGDQLRKGLLFLADNLETIIKWVGRLVKFLLVYKARLLALKLLQSQFGKSLIQTAKGFKNIGKSAKGAVSGLKAMGRAMKGIGFSLAIGLAIELVAELWNMVSGANAAADAQARLNKQLERSGKQANKRSDDRQKNLNDEINALARLRDEKMAAAKTDRERVKLEREFLEEQEKLIKEAEKQIKVDIQNVNKRKEATKAALEEQRKDLRKWFKERGLKPGVDLTDLSTLDLARLGVGAFTDEYKKLSSAVSQSNADLAGQNKRLKIYYDELERTTEAQLDATSSLKTFNNESRKSEKPQKKINTEFRNQIDLLEELNKHMETYNDTMQEINQVEFDQDIDAINRQIMDQVEMLGWIAESGEKADTSGIAGLIEERKLLQIQAVNESTEYEINELKRKNQVRFKDMRAALKKEYDALIAGADGNEAAIAKIEANYASEREKIRLLELDAQQTLGIQIEQKTIEKNNRIEEIEREANDELIEIKNELNDATIAGLEERADKAQELADAELEREKERARERMEIIKAITDFALKQADERIKAIDKEIAASQKQADFLREKAAQGNISAQESLAEENRIIAEAEREKEEIQKRKQRIQLVSAVLQAYNANLAEGLTSTEAFTKAVTDTTILTQFLNALPGFFEGTEDTGTAGFMRDEHGVITGYTHANERVLTADQNKRIGDYSNEQVADIMERHRLGKTIDGAQLSVGWGNEILVEELMNVGNKLDQVNKTIQNKPETNIELGQITESAMNIVQRTKRGPMTTQKTFIVKPR